MVLSERLENCLLQFGKAVASEPLSCRLSLYGQDQRGPTARQGYGLDLR
jgi:hypothetical protein